MISQIKFLNLMIKKRKKGTHQKIHPEKEKQELTGFQCIQIMIKIV